MHKISFKTYRNFVVTREIEIPEIDVTLVELRHEITGAQVLHLLNDDDENLFCLSFRTLPETSNGVAHILEHTVLCGSEKFPVKDPFFSMNRRSLNTFMNAFTGADFTCYPASSQVPKDFYNLLEVYIDAVFKPRLSRLSFMQEGHRFEFTSEDEKSALALKGIVYNEMKGAMASPDQRLSEAIMEALFPEITYAVNSGGSPVQIPQLTYEELKEFHQKYYHPSRCLFYFYGNLPLEKHLDFLEEHALKGVSKTSPLPPIKPVKRFKEKLWRTLTYPIAKDEETKDKTIVSLSWLTTSILQQEELLALNVIDLVLMGTDASPLKMALLKSGLCKQADSSLEDEISEVPFFITCKGCSIDAAKPLEKVVLETLENIVKEGLPPHLVDGAIHQLELSRSEISVPFGLTLYFRSALLKQHGGHPEDGLKIHTLFKKLRDDVKDHTYLTGLIKKYFLDNPHFVGIVMHPDPALQAQELHEEQDNLKKIEENLSEEEKTLIIAQTEELLAYQEEDDDQKLEILPTVTLEDVPQEGKEFALKQESFGALTVYYHPCFTNDILYADLVFDLPAIAEDDLPYLRLFTLLLPQLGCGGRDYKSHLDYTFEHTGGIGVDLELSAHVLDPSIIKPALLLRGKALYRKVDKLFPLFQEMILSVDFTDQERLLELLKQHLDELENSIQNSPMRYAITLSASGLSIPLKIRQSLYGLSYFWKLKEIVKTFTHHPEKLISKLQSLHACTLGLNKGDLVLACDETMIEVLKEKEFFGLTHALTKEYSAWQENYHVEKINSQGRLTATPVAFTALSFPVPGYTHETSAPLSIASKIMENKTLHKRIREQGGAYGSGSSNVPMSGYFYLYSYRDPHLAATKEAFLEAIQELIKGDFEEQDLFDAKLGIIQELDSPLSPGSRSYVAYERLRCGRTPERRQQYRRRLLSCSKKEVSMVAQTLLAPGFEKGTLVSFAGKEFLEKENLLLKEKALPLYPI